MISEVTNTMQRVEKMETQSTQADQSCKEDMSGCITHENIMTGTEMQKVDGKKDEAQVVASFQ